MGDALKQMRLSSAGGFKRTCIVDQAVRLELVQVVRDGWKTQAQLFGNDLAGALPVILNQAVNIACIS